MRLIVCGSEASEYGALSTNDHFDSSEKPSNLKQQPSQGLPSRKPQIVAKHLATHACGTSRNLLGLNILL